jgi:hypothetical protein
VATLFYSEKPILYENGEEEPPTVVSAPNRRIVASEKKTHTQKDTHLLSFSSPFPAPFSLAVVRFDGWGDWEFSW